MFTGLFDLKSPGEYPYMLVDGGSAEVFRGKPPVERIRHEVSFKELPEDVRAKVLEAYRGMWGIEG